MHQTDTREEAGRGRHPLATIVWPTGTDLLFEHPVPSFDAWKKAFDSDPVNRKQSGVRRYRVLRPIDNPNYAIIDLEFDSVNEAEGLLAALREVWRGVQGTIIESPRVRIVEAVESKEL